MTRHTGNAGRRVSLRSTMTCQPRTSPRPEPVLATSAGWPPEGSAARTGWDRLVAVIHRHPLLTDVALAAIRRNPLLADAAVAAAVLALSVPQVITPPAGSWSRRWSCTPPRRFCWCSGASIPSVSSGSSSCWS